MAIWGKGHEEVGIELGQKKQVVDSWIRHVYTITDSSNHTQSEFKHSRASKFEASEDDTWKHQNWNNNWFEPYDLTTTEYDGVCVGGVSAAVACISKYNTI